MGLFKRKGSTTTIQTASSAPLSKPRTSRLNRLPWIEAGGTIVGVSLFYFVLHKNELAEFFAITGALMTLGRLGYTEKLEKEIEQLRAPLDQIREYFDISARGQIDLFRDVLEVYMEIIEDEFARVKDGILVEARSQLLVLANEKKSEILSTTKYYGWLLPMLEKANPPQRIWALSLMRQAEWDNSQPERRFLELSRQAAERGVQIDRVFVMKKAIIADALKNSAIQLHLRTQKPENLLGYVVEEETLRSTDEELAGRLGDGFIVFDDRVALVDVFSSKGARGYVTMNRLEIAHLREVYDGLAILAEDLDSFANRNVQAPAVPKAT